MSKLETYAWESYDRMLSGGGDGDSFGVHIEYMDLYKTVVFLVAIYASGQIASRFLRMPDLVGEIICGIVMGPELLDFVHNTEAWVMFGELGLVLLVIEAGIDIDLSTLKLIGTRGCLIAFFGSILPIGLGMLITWALGMTDTKEIIAAGSVFGPTSLGIALNILRNGGILNTPVGQLIISAAVIDDMIALVVLSQLKALSGEITAAGILIPIVSAIGFLIIGGYVAIFILPPIIRNHILSRVDEKHHAKVELGIMFFLVLALMPATYYAKASYLMGCFVAGLTFCSFHELHHAFVRQFKRLLQWLMRIFFAASIGFQVPVQSFNDAEVIWQGLVYTLALIGKVGVGFMVPNFSIDARFTGKHLRDCLITGFSMAAEGEFAFVIAVFAVGDGLFDKKLYAKVVLAVLLSTIVPPFLLRFTISYYNKKGEEAVEDAAKEEDNRRNTKTSQPNDADIVHGILQGSTIFLCIQTQCESKWGLLNAIMGTMAKKNLDVIDHRAWSPRGIHTTLVNEVYARTKVSPEYKDGEDPTAAIEHATEVLMKDVDAALSRAIGQPGVAKVKVQRWYPGVIQEICEEVDEKSHKNVTQRLLKEASSTLERRQSIQTMATVQKSIEQIMGDGETAKPEAPAPQGMPAPAAEKPKPRRRVRQKMRSTPVVGGGLFGEAVEAKSGRDGSTRISDFNKKKGDGLDWTFGSGQTGIPADITVKGEVYSIRIGRDTWKDLQKGFHGQMVDHRGIEISQMNIEASDDAPIVQRLTGFVRNMPLRSISEDDSHLDSVSERSLESSRHGDGQAGLSTTASMDNDDTIEHKV
ncbi:unnamed protein product [Cylindrotheca closterium]|uniref:Cation/H+ exchanger transmembrane domain-containing protein n=1 Tax=Cylindrotheca closterium TaxID=2856 RepID=A0AAD2G901_9STRA|nr:unnamed protein product [Cylindrotheca closterium]